MSETPYIDGKINGNKKKYRNSALIVEVPYINDEQNDIATLYYDDGEIETTITFNNNIKALLQKDIMKAEN